MKKILSLTVVSVAVAMTMVACGGGGSETAGSGGGSSNNNMTISLSPGEDVSLKAGDHYAIKAVATAKGVPVTSLKWKVTALEGQSDTVKPLVSDANCENVARSGGGTVNGVATNGNASCETYLVIPSAGVSGKWEVKAVASTASGTDVGYSAFQSFKVDTGKGATEVSNSPSEFKLVIPARPIQIEQGKIATVDASYTVKEGTKVENLKYEWSVVTGTALLAGASTSSVSFITAAGGNYLLKVKVTGKMNGVEESVEGTVVVATTTAATPTSFNVSAGVAQITNTNTVVTLKGDVTSASCGGTGSTTVVSCATSSDFTYSWKQTSGTTVSLSNASTLTPTFIPKSSGMYEFELTATNSIATKTAKTQVGVNTITVAASPVQIVTVTSGGTVVPKVVNLTATTTGTASLISYTWTQTNGLSVAIANANTPNASFLADTPGVYNFRITATADGVSQSSDTIVYVQ